MVIEKPKVSIKKESFKKRGFIVARDERGRFVTLKRAIKGFTSRKAKEIFKRNNTFNEKVIRDFSLANVIEIQDFRRLPQKPSKEKTTRIQYFIRMRLKDGRIVVARSQQHNLDYSKQKMKQEAMENAFSILAETLGLGYDEDKGQKAFEEIKDDIKIDEGFVYYVKP